MTTVLSDTPRSLRRRWYTDQGRVDEHTHAVTCKCVKCVVVAEERPKLGPDVTPAAPRRPNEVERDFVWLLAKVGESTSRRLGLPLCVPETLVLAKGKAERLYFVDPEDGVPAQMGGWAKAPRLQVQKASKVDLPFGVLLKTFYRLHRTRWTEKRPEAPKPLKRGRSRSPGRTGRRLLKQKTEPLPFDVHSDEMLRVMYSDASSGFLTESMVRSQLRDEKFARTCRPGRCTVVGSDATNVQRNDSFWQEVTVVQTVPWKDPEYISYRYHRDGARQATELEERYGVRSRAAVGGVPLRERTNIEEQVLRLPLAISEHLREHHDLDLVSGTFELVHDRRDGVLWLANAVHLRVAPAEYQKPDVESSADDFVGTVRYFREEQFLQAIDAHEPLCKGREDLQREPNQQRYTQALQRMREPEQAQSLLRCRISDQIYPQDLLDKFAPYRIVKLYYPLQQEAENEYAFLEFSSAQDRRQALALSESVLNDTVLQMSTSTKVRLAEALSTKAFDTYDGPGQRGPGAGGEDPEPIEVLEEPPKIPVFLDTMEAQMRDWFYKAEPVHPPDPVGEVLRHIGAEPRDPPGGGFSQRFEPAPLDIRLCHAPEQEPDFVVSGAGGKGCLVNGPYKRKWMRNEHPMYQKIGGTAIIYFQGFWKMHDCDDTERWYYAVKEAAGPEPPTGRWSCYGYSEGDAMPPPTVTKVVPPYPHSKDVSLWQSRVCRPRLARSSSVCETEMRRRKHVETPDLMATWAQGLGAGPVKPDSPSRLGTLGTTDWSRTSSTWASSGRPGSVLSRASTARSQLQRTASSLLPRGL